MTPLTYSVVGAVQNPSFVLSKPHTVSYEDRPVPELQDPHDVLIHIKQTGICGSDVGPLTLSTKALSSH
jgi:threonine dehydrogenase-like Zn-dependent dehydrogenase